MIANPRHARACFTIAAVVMALLPWEACHTARRPAPPITLKLIDQAWVDQSSRRLRDEERREFTKATGIRVEVLPSPEAAVEQVTLWRQLLESHATVPDVYAVDVIWPGILADDLLDLKPYVPKEEIAAHFPELIANNTVGGRLVALPYDLSAGVLYYRLDLLREYGYNAPPKTWEGPPGGFVSSTRATGRPKLPSVAVRRSFAMSSKAFRLSPGPLGPTAQTHSRTGCGPNTPGCPTKKLPVQAGSGPFTPKMSSTGRRATSTASRAGTSWRF